ncbi:uncharacterized protein Z519_02024 [Cladophialophora bantiana CBS 173.52]|uniref:Uncharacterized protein n=1 Tax=Cladophialophora bantiana (strain ATCC 10958 / CBS 173.52 / CDC B-1940 / NIH 8579) TaxID=1442370 RepID=A0A0D2HT29_CLAB1|nr:uncharacterized protein Z519_02024 [Cladophialophora bantiana CBS 173.52]KIW96633.1 hypothetical protein Z519_02024 [Cladophialophora bantiana CBS 173.52]
MYRNDLGPQAPRTLRPSHPSSNMQSRFVQSSHRSERMGTTTQLEGFAPNASPSTHQSPISRGNIRLLAAIGNRDSHSELGRLRSAVEGLEDGQMNQNRFIPPSSDSTEPLELPEIDVDSSPEEVDNMVQHMIDYLVKWTDVKHVEGSATVFQDIRLINASLQNIMELPEEVISSPTVRAALRTFRKRYETFATIWARAIHRALIGKLSEVESQAKRHPSTFPESRFTSLVSEIRTVSSEYALLVLLDSAHDNIKLLVPPGAAKELLEHCAHLHQVFQNAAYNSEQKELWLLIWRGLKTAFTAFEQGGAPKSPTNVERDRKFFEIPGVYREFERLISSSDAANPRSIEDMVGKYCRYIDECQVDPGNKYESLQRPRDAPLESHTKEALKEFIQTGKFETSTLSKIHFAVARFNKITGGPIKIRRWQHDVGHTEWETFALDLPSPALRDTVERRPTYSDLPLSARSQLTFVEIDGRESLETAVPEESSKGLFPYPKGVNMKSAFDYVYYPFPETRAHELVQHEQISREMGQPGMISEGPRVEYLINQPPRHARDPADLSVSKKTLGPLEWIRLVMHQVLPQRRPVPDAKHPKVSVLPSRRSQKLSTLNQRALPIDPKARVHKVPTATPDLKLRGGGPQSSRLGPSSKRKCHFNPLAFRQMMVETLQREIIRRELESGRGGLSKYLPDDSMLYLLEQTTYDVQKAVHLWQLSMGYRGIGLAGNTTKEPHHYLSAGEMASNQAASKMSPLFGGIPVDNNAAIYAYRLETLAPSATSPVAAHSPHGDDSDDDNQAHDQPLPRPALGELPVDVGVYDENGSEHSSQHSSNRENHPPRPPQPPQPPQPPHHSPTPEPILSQCHPCPMYEGQYHHVCRCTHVEYPELPPPDSFDGNYNSAGRPNRGSSPQPANNESEDPVDEGNDAPVGGTPGAARGRNRRPPREEPRSDDELYVREVFAGDQGYENALRDGGNGNFASVVRSILSGGLEWTVDHESRAILMTTIGNLAEEIRKLKDRYLELLEEGPKPFMEGLNDSRIPNPDVPATVDICQRAAIDMRNHHARLLQFFNYEHPRTHLGFRHQFNRFVRALRELRQLVEEYDHENPQGNSGGDHHQQDQGSRTRDESVNQEEGSDDTHSDSETTLSPREKTRLVNHPTSPKRYKALALPTRGEYELMFVDEMERELQKNRGVKDLENVLGKKYKKADLIDKLMALDGEGCLGHGATECYRHITGNPTSRGRPKRFNLEKALTQYHSNRKNERILAQRARKDARRQARIGWGIHSPAPVMPRVQPSQMLFTQPTGAIDAETQTTWSQDSEESDTWSEDIADP